MVVRFRPKFRRDVEVVNDSGLLIALQQKLVQISNAASTDNVTGLKLLRGYATHYRIIVKTDQLSYRIGAIIRGNTIWVIRFLPRKTVYTKFP